VSSLENVLAIHRISQKFFNVAKNENQGDGGGNHPSEIKTPPLRNFDPFTRVGLRYEIVPTPSVPGTAEQQICNGTQG
jgi:hypothetical protein